MIRKIEYEDGKDKIAAGIHLLCRALTLEGGILVNGRYCFSAFEVARELEGTNLFINQGIRLASKTIGEINEITGCGTRETASVLDFLLAAYEKKAAQGISPVYLKKRLKQASEIMIQGIGKHSFDSGHSRFELLEEITKDPVTAKMIDEGSKDGELVVKESMFAETRLERIEGMRIEGALVTGEAGSIHQARVLVVSSSISSFQKLLPLLKKMEDQELFILADDILGEAKSLLEVNIKKKRILAKGIKAPYIGRRKEDLLKDVAVLTGTEVFDGTYPYQLEEITPDMLGKAETIIVTGTDTVISGAPSSPQVLKRIQSIYEKIDDPKTNFYDQQILRERIASLKGCVPVMYAGGETLVESQLEKRRIECAAAYAEIIKTHGLFKKEDLSKITPDMEEGNLLFAALLRGFLKTEISVKLLALIIQKICGLIGMWLMTGAVMVSTGYDREDLELIKNGVDVERLRD
ncbi:hypothetical protein [Clostridium sp. E02]|uniref:hypothetical protein n=1 Tax=Clostridium sp. E02 TaxID=2487134 RepID=UPI000F5352F3|nr:hypothetical protein [Clostridium sp. E02]